MSKAIVVGVLLASLPLGACRVGPESSGESMVGRAKDAYFAAWTKASGEVFTTDRLAGVMLTTPEFYSVDGMVPTPPGPTIDGWEAYQTMWDAGMNQFVTARLIEISTSRSWNGRDLAATTSACRVTGTMSNGQSLDLPANVTLVYRKIGGEWKIVHENMNVSKP